MILNAQQIIAALNSGEISIIPFDPAQVQAASYDLRVGETGATTTSKKLVNIREAGFLLLQPGDFAVLTVFEEMRLDAQHVARFGLRSKFARKGLIATTGPQVDPGYHGRLILGLTNLTPRSISIPYKDDLITIEIHRLNEPTDRPYAGPYQDKLDLGPEEIEAVTETEGMALPEVITTLRSLSANVGILASEFKSQRSYVSNIVGFGIGGMAILIAIIGVLLAVLIEFKH
jgi:dCTP deaminase